MQIESDDGATPELAAERGLDPAGMLVLAAIADGGSLTAGARLLGTTQPALSKRLRRLEQALGVPLFERGLRGVQPTEYGAALLPRARTIRTQIRQGLQDVGQLRGVREGEVGVALSHFATIALLPQVMPAFRRDWPDVQLRIAPPTFSLGGLRQGTPDFAVISPRSSAPGGEFVTRGIYATTLVVVARRGHPLAAATCLADLGDAQWVEPSLESANAQALEKAFRRASAASPRCLVTCETLTGIELLVAGSDLLAPMPLEVHEARASASGLIALPIEPIAGPRVAIVRWADARPTAPAAALEDLFVKAAHRLARSRRRSGEERRG